MIPPPRLPDGAPCALAVTDETGTVLSANRSFFAWSGRDETGAIGRMRIEDAFQGGSQLYFRTFLMPQLRISGRIEPTAVALAGDPPQDVLLSAARDPGDGSFCFALLQASERIRHERELAAALHGTESRLAWLEQIEDLAGIGAWSQVVGEDSLRWSERAFELHGLPPGDPIPLHQALALYPDAGKRTEFARLLARASAEGEPFETETQLLAPDGTRRKLRLYGEPVWDHGRVVRVAGIVQDITAQRRAERERDEAAAHLAAIADNLPGVLISVERQRDGELAAGFVSSGCNALLGIPAEALRNDIRELDGGPGRGTRGLAKALERAMRGAAPASGRYLAKLRDGSEKWLELRGSVTAGSDGPRADCVILDVTAEVAAQAEAARQATMAQKAQKFESLGQLTGGVAHDFNNLLAVILGSLELLGETVDEPSAQTLIASAIQAAERGAGLTRSLLAFARKARLDPKPCDLNALVTETAGWAARTIPSNIRLETKLSDGLWPVQADVDATSSVVLNLLLNARDAMPGGGRLELRTSNVEVASRADATEELAPGNYVRLDVSDTGTGMPPEVAARIFEPFFTTKEQGKGTGLGLAMVQGFMSQSGGSIRLDSAPGKGTCFSLYFPARPAGMEAEAAGPAAISAVRSGGRILVAEDEPGVLLVVKAMLEREGYAVVPASTGEAAAELFEEGAFDLLLTDIVMPGRLLGPALAAELRRRAPDLPVIFMSGYADDAAIAGGEISADDIRLGKPVHRADLLEAVARALAEPPAGTAPAAPAGRPEGADCRQTCIAPLPP